jgi:hypothetical protein
MRCSNCRRNITRREWTAIKGLYERQIRIVDAQIDRLVYDLYELTEGEIKVVEGEK